MGDWKRRACLVATLLAVSGLLFTGLASGAGGTARAKGTLTVAFIGDMSGVFAPTSGAPSVAAAQAAIDAANAKGGVNGYQIKLKVYDTASSASGGVTAIRRAINDKVFAVLTDSNPADSGLSLLAASKIPGFAPGDSPSWIGKTHTTLFPYEGNLSTQNSTAWMKFCVDHGRTKFAVPAGTSAGAKVYADTWAKMTAAAGGTTVLEKVGVDTSNAASIQALAQEIIDAGANCVASLIIGGDPQLQAAINQLGGDVWVVSPSAFGPSVEQQFGKAADHLLYANFFAALSQTSNKGVQEYLADMKKYQPKQEPLGFWVKAYATARFFLHTLEQVKGTPTGAKVAAIANKTHGYDVDGLVPPIYFPEFHTVGQLCLGYSQLMSGKWQPVSGTNKLGYICGKRFGV